MKKYPSHLIESFIVYARTLNMVNSAKELGISQPALSRQLKDFESQIGQSLFKSQGRNKILTPIGHEIFIKLGASWSDYSALINETCEIFSEKPREAIKVYGPTDMIARYAQTLKYRYPLDFAPAESEVMESLLSSNDISLGISRLINEESQLVSKFLVQLDFYLVFPKSWQIAEASFGVRLLKKIAEYPRVAFRKDSINKNLIQLLEQVKFRYQTIIPNWHTILQLAKSGKGWALAPNDVLDFYSEYKKDLICIKVPHEIVAPVKYYLLYRKDLAKIHWFKELLDEISQQSKKT